MNKEYKEDIRTAKFTLVFISLVFGVVTFVTLTVRITMIPAGFLNKPSIEFANDPILSLLIAAAVAFVYPVIAAFVVFICEHCRSWAYLNDVNKWNKGTKIYLGAFWPLLLIWSLIIYTFLAIVNRLFRED